MKVTVCIGSSCHLKGSRNVVERLKELIEEKFPNLKAIEIDTIGTVIGSHTGPGTVALFFWGDKRVD